MMRKELKGEDVWCNGAKIWEAGKAGRCEGRVFGVKGARKSWKMSVAKIYFGPEAGSARGRG